MDISDSIDRMFEVIFLWLPKLLSALIILIIGYWVARAIKSVVTKALRAAKFDNLLEVSPIGDFLRRLTSSPARVVGTMVFWLVYFGVVSLAVSVLGIPALTAFIASIYAYLPNVVAAVLIFLVAASVSTALAGLVAKTMGDTPTGKLIGAIVPTLTMVIAVFMILTQLRIAPEIVQITYAGLVATMVLAVGLSVGLGGREVAAEIVSETYHKGRSNAGKVRQDVETGKQRAQESAHELREKHGGDIPRA